MVMEAYRTAVVEPGEQEVQKCWIEGTDGAERVGHVDGNATAGTQRRRRSLTRRRNAGSSLKTDTNNPIIEHRRINE